MAAAVTSKFICCSCRTYASRSANKLPFSAPSLKKSSSLVQQRLLWTKLGNALPFTSASSAFSSSTPPTVLASPSTSPLELFKQAQEAGARGQSLSVTDPNGERHILANVPMDEQKLRKYSWRSAEWTWGVLERLFQDCARPATLKFRFENWTDENDGGKVKRRIAGVDNDRDIGRLHIGEGDGWFINEIGLPKTFNTWVAVCFLHMWILKVRIRQFPRRMSHHWNELLTNHFFWEAERTMDADHKIDAVSRRKYLDQFFQIWTATILAYDEALVRGDDAVLAAALWRLLFNGEPEVDPAKIAMLVGYTRRELARVGRLDDKVLVRGYVGFGEPFSLGLGQQNGID